MAKKTAKRPAAKPAAGPAQTGHGVLEPQKVHELLGLPGPYDPPPPPMKLNEFVTFWDPGCSLQSLAMKHHALFYRKDFPERFAKETDSRWWKQIRLLAVEPGEPFADQRKKLRLGEPPAAREVVTFLVLHALATGERIAIPDCGAGT